MDDFQKQMKEYLQKITENVANDVSNDAFECLKKHIADDMYQPYNLVYIPSRGTQPSGEFLNAFELDTLRKGLNSSIRSVIYNWGTIHTWTENYTYTDARGNIVTREVPVHQSVFGEDVREALFDILRNRNNRGCMPNRPVAYYKDFWEEFINDLKMSIGDWVEKSLRKQGIQNFTIEINPNELGGGD